MAVEIEGRCEMNFKVPVRFSWRQWVPDERHSVKDVLGDATRLGLASLRADGSAAHKEFLRLWDYWNSQYPGKWVLTTLTSERDEHYGCQLRFWFGEPASFSSSFVDSCGHNLIAHVTGEESDLAAFAESLQGEAFQETLTQESCRIWRRIC